MTGTTAERVKQVVVEQLGVDEEEVTPQARIMDDLGCDSMDIVELMMAAEEEFGIEISNEDFEKLLTVGEAVTYIDARIAAKKAAV
jgi:acyl carrier protein